MSYKIKSLLYFAAFMASIAMYYVLQDDKSEKVIVNQPIEQVQEVTDNVIDAQEEAQLLEDMTYKN